MAQKVEVFLIDDIDGGEAAETVSFSLDGKAYEIDLSEKNAKKLRKVLTAYVEASRKAPKQGGPKPSTGRTPVDKEKSRTIREWAKQAGIDINERGRIPGGVMEKYEAAQAATK